MEAKKAFRNRVDECDQEAYINGVSTRKIDKLTKTLGIESISRSQVSAITKDLNEQVDAFRTRKLEATYPVLWVDALYERIRDNQRVQNMAVLVVTGINTEGKRDILAVEPMYEESAASYTKVFDQLKERGLEKVWLVVSDAHKGLVKAARESFLGCSWHSNTLARFILCVTYWHIFQGKTRNLLPKNLNKSGCSQTMRVLRNMPMDS